MDKKPIKKEKKLTRKVKSSISKLNKTNNPKAFKKKSDVPWQEDYKELITADWKPINSVFLEHLGEELINFAQTTEGPLRLEWFFVTRRIPYTTAFDWAQKYDNFKISYQTAKYILGMRREDGAIRKVFDREAIFKSQHRYDPEAKEDAQFHAKLKQDVLSGMEGAKVIILDKLFEDKESK